MPTQGPSSIPVTINIPVPQTVTDKPKQQAAPQQPQPVAQTAPAPSVPPPSSQNPMVMGGDVRPPITALILPWTPDSSQGDDLDMSMMDQPKGGLTPGTRSGVPTKPRPYLKKRRIVIE